MATNRGVTKIRGTNYYAPHGIPLDLLDRLLIIQTKPYEPEDLQHILEIRCQEEDVQITDKGLKLLTKIGGNTSLRYAINLITTANICAVKRKSAELDVEDIRRVYELFVDVKRSSQFLQDY